VTRELGAGQAPAVLQRFVEEELARAEAYETLALALDPAEVRARADEVFRRIVG
jgi:hypothetical protein